MTYYKKNASLATVIMRCEERGNNKYLVLEFLLFILSHYSKQKKGAQLMTSQNMTFCDK